MANLNLQTFGPSVSLFIGLLTLGDDKFTDWYNVWIDFYLRGA